jgi:hypothetical protein
MKFVLFLLYYSEGFFMAMIACSGIGFVLAALIALLKSVVRPKNLLLMLFYGVAAVLCYLLFLGGLFLAGWLGDQTDHAGQGGILVGAVFPGLGGLAIIPQFIAVALRQTSGKTVQ